MVAFATNWSYSSVLLNSALSDPVMVGVSFSSCSAFKPLLPMPNRSVAMGASPDTDTSVTTVAIACAPVTVVFPDDVAAVPPSLRDAPAKEKTCAPAG